MQIENIRRTVAGTEYGFLRDDPRLGNNMLLLGLGGSIAYGTDTPDSDIDIRGFAVNSREEILLAKDFEQVVDEKTDTVIYSFRKMVSLLAECNPNTIEILGLRPEHYLYLSDVGRYMIENAGMFLSKRAADTFGGYALQQLRRLDNKAARTLAQEERERHILGSIRNASVNFPDRYHLRPEDVVHLFLDDSEQEDFNKEIFMDVALKHYPLRDYLGMVSEMQNILRDYNKVGKRNRNAIEHDKLAKHMMHLVRLYLMARDILDDGVVRTYREEEHDFLMSVRNGKYLDENDHPTKEFRELVDELEARHRKSAAHTVLPAGPDMERIERLVTDVHGKVVAGEFRSCFLRKERIYA